MPAWVPDNSLMAAVKACREDKVRALLDCGCREDAVDADGRTALHWACQYGHLRIACWLVSSAAMSDCASCQRGGHVNDRTSQVERGGHVNDKTSQVERGGHVNDKTSQVERGGHVNDKTSQVERGGHVNDKASQVERGGHVNDKTSQVERGGHVNDKTSQVERGGHVNDKTSQVERGGLVLETSPRRLYDMLNRRDAKGHTALHVACNFRREEVAVFLATLPQCDVNAGDLQGHTPLHRAVRCSLDTVAGALCEAGADVTARNTALWTPLHEAARTGNARMVRMLVNRGCDVNAVTNSGMTPFLTAVFYYRIAQRCAYQTLDDVLRHLLEAGCRLSQADSQWTPLSAAVAVDSSLLAALLLFHGCRFERRCGAYGRSLLVEAFSRCEPFVARLLVECGYQPNSEEIEACSRRIPSFSPVFLRLDVVSTQTVLKEKYQLLHWLRQRTQSVCSLCELCRTAIRLALNQATADSSILKPLAHLPLPLALVEFVRLQKFTEHFTLC